MNSPSVIGGMSNSRPASYPATRLAIRWILLSATYFVIGKFGLQLAFVHPSVSPVWPATGVAMAALLIFGYADWPAILVGAWVVNFTTAGSAAVALGIAVGNTLEALAGAFAINRFCHGRRFLEDPRDVLKFTLFAAVLSPILSATFGLISLAAGGNTPGDSNGPLWLTWWLGDMVGAIVVTPALVALSDRRRTRWPTRQKVEALLLALGLAAVIVVIFSPVQRHSLAVLCIPLVVAAAFRLGQAGTVAFNLGLALASIACTLRGWGPFVDVSPNLSLLSLQAFMGTSAVMSMVIAGVVSQRKHFEQRLHVKDTLGRLYLENVDSAALVTKILETIAQEFGWEFAALWTPESPGGPLRCEATWRSPDVQEPFDWAARQTSLIPGEGLPGLVWSRGEPLWVSDFSNAAFYPPVSGASKIGGRAAFGFPIRTHQGLVGIVEFFGRNTLSDDLAARETFTALGNQIAHYLERSRLERDRAELNRTLELQVLSRTDELLRKEAQLHQAGKLEAVGRLAGGIAHDFNNLLTGILGISEDLLGSLDDQDPRRADVQDIMAAAQRAFTVTRQLLAFGRRQVVQPRNLDLNATLSETNKLLHRIIGEDIEIKLDFNSVPAIQADPSQIEQIILNLALNARDAMPQGGQLKIRTCEAVVSKNATRPLRVPPGRYVLLEVSDTGTGMKQEVLDHIFEPFFTTKEPGKGTGLGLATVYGIVEQNQGDIVVSSALGKGTRFQVYWPESREKPARSADRAMGSGAGGSEIIMVVEDEEIVRRIITKKLSQAGYRVLQAAGGREAIELTQAHDSIDLVITDVVMPDLNGRQTVEMIRKMKPSVKVIYVSGYPEDVIARHGVLHPGVRFIEKPLLNEHLLPKVREALDA